MSSISFISYLRSSIALSFVLWIPAASAMLASTLNYQAYVTDITGSPIEGEQSVTFRLYTTQNSASMVWQETQQLTIKQGLLQAQLGTVTSLNLPDDFDTPLFLGIEIDFDGEMSPRQPLTLSGYAVQAANADTLDGQDADALDQSSHVSDTRNPHAVSAAQIGAATLTDIREHVALPEEHHARYKNAEAVAAVQSHDGSDVNADTLDGSDSTAFASTAHTHGAIYYTQSQVDSLLTSLRNEFQARFEQLEEKLAKVTVSADGNQIYVTGANLHLRSGGGSTDGSVNGLGNLIVGYDEMRTSGSSTCSLGSRSTEEDCIAFGGIWSLVHRSGSHNIVVGKEHNYSRFGGLVVGQRNTISGDYASVSGGEDNTASDTWASVSGGGDNTAGEGHASVSGGQFNTASGQFTSVSGGFSNFSTGYATSVTGGQRNTASSHTASVSGGQNNTAEGDYASVSGGQNNFATGGNASVSGGSSNVASGNSASVGGGTLNSASQLYSAVSGGRQTTASRQDEWCAAGVCR